MRVKKQKLTTLNAGKNAEQQKCSFIAGGNTKCGTARLEDRLVICYTPLRNNLAVALLSIYPNEVENCVHCDFITNQYLSNVLKATKMSLSR